MWSGETEQKASLILRAQSWVYTPPGHAHVHHTHAHTHTQRNERVSMHENIHICTARLNTYVHPVLTTYTQVHADTPMDPLGPQQAVHTHPRVHTQSACTYLSPHSHSSQVSVPDKFKVAPRPRYFPSCFLGCRGKRRGWGRRGQAGQGRAEDQDLRPQLAREGFRVPDTAPRTRIPAPAHLQAGHPDAHRPHEQQVVGQELLQLGDTASLEGSKAGHTPLGPEVCEDGEGGLAGGLRPPSSGRPDT